MGLALCRIIPRRDSGTRRLNWSNRGHSKRRLWSCHWGQDMWRTRRTITDNKTRRTAHKHNAHRPSSLTLTGGTIEKYVVHPCNMGGICGPHAPPPPRRPLWVDQSNDSNHAQTARFNGLISLSNDSNPWVCCSALQEGGCPYGLLLCICAVAANTQPAPLQDPRPKLHSWCGT